MQNLNVAVIQSTLAWEDIEANLNHLDSFFSDLKKETDLVVLPEMFSTSFSMNPMPIAEKLEDSKAIAWMQAKAQKHNIAIVGSLIIQEGNDYFNRMIWMEADGIKGQYDKRHLFRLTHEEEVFTGGNKRSIVEYKNWRFNLNICYDLRFPVWARNKGDYDVLVYVANWPAKRQYAWSTLLKARAIENQAFVLGCNRVGVDGNEHKYNGFSAIIDYAGNVLEEKDSEEGILYQTLEKGAYLHFRESFPFHMDGDQFTIH